jgi:hypothetical protein
MNVREELQSMREIALFVCVVFALALSGEGQQGKSLSGGFHNDRLKRAELNDYEITGDGQWRRVSGMWVPESNDPAHKLLFLEQVTINCRRPSSTCEELKIVLEPTGGIIFIDGVDETTWQITSWDEHGLLATYDADLSAISGSDKCHRHVLSMSFSSGAVSTSDIPTHEKGCEAFKATDSYRLKRGVYYVDTTPGNDAEKPVKPDKVHPPK